MQLFSEICYTLAINLNILSDILSLHKSIDTHVIQLFYCLAFSLNDNFLFTAMEYCHYANITSLLGFQSPQGGQSRSSWHLDIGS